MAHSNTSLNTFTNCAKAYEHTYILKTPKDNPDSPHLRIGVIGHEILHDAGVLRDTYDGEFDDQCELAIPSEVAYPDLKEFFGILSWHEYFHEVLFETYEIETSLCREMTEPYEILRERKLSRSVQELQQDGFKGVHTPVVGVIDLLILGKTSATIVDYKFSTKPKTQDNFDMDSQLYIYAYLVHKTYNIPLRNIKIGYIDICKKQFGPPKYLQNARLSVDKTQFVLPKVYKEAVLKLHGEDPKYNCEPGGYYYECYMSLQSNRQARENIQQLDIEAMKGIVTDFMEAASLVDKLTENHGPFVKKFDSYSCKNCDYLSHCKPWLNIW